MIFTFHPFKSTTQLSLLSNVFFDDAEVLLLTSFVHLIATMTKRSSVLCDVHVDGVRRIQFPSNNKPRTWNGNSVL